MLPASFPPVLVVLCWSLLYFVFLFKELLHPYQLRASDTQTNKQQEDQSSRAISKSSEQQLKQRQAGQRKAAPSQSSAVESVSSSASKHEVSSSVNADEIHDRFVTERGIWSSLAAQATIYFMLSMWYFHWRSKHYPNEGMMWNEWLGFVLGMCGDWLRSAAKRELGRFFTFTIGIRPGHNLITTGPYKYLLHPSYTGAMMHTIGVGVFIWCPKVTLFHSFMWVVFLKDRIRDEESMLLKEFGADFEQRKKTTARLIPFIF